MIKFWAEWKGQSKIGCLLCRESDGSDKKVDVFTPKVENPADISSAYSTGVR